MTGYKKIFLDTTPLIYFLDADINYAEKVERIFEGLIENRSSMVTSTVTCTEYLTYPYRTGNTEKIDVFFEFLTDCNVQIQPIDINTAKKAAQIRARYKDFKTMDCLQLATACLKQCDLFLTNDKQLRQFDEVKCMVVDDFNQL
ncbi:PIN domain-containing protein [Lachnospiraceae bacterium]|jgi:predicted nucleic acid-binding protein|nr:PIN domain-containing protein [Lachnospiraceae bacterium]